MKRKIVERIVHFLRVNSNLLFQLKRLLENIRSRGRIVSPRVEPRVEPRAIDVKIKTNLKNDMVHDKIETIRFLIARI